MRIGDWRRETVGKNLLSVRRHNRTALRSPCHRTDNCIQWCRLLHPPLGVDMATLRRSLVVLLVAVASHTANAQAARKPVPVRGVAFDGLRGQPIRNARVTLVGDSVFATTDSRGRFRFESVTPGVHTFAMKHATLDSLGFTGLSTRATIVTGDEEVKLSVPTFDVLWAAACGGRVPKDSGFVYGTVRDAEDRVPVTGAHIDVVWTDLSLDKRRGVVQHRWRSQTKTDSTGSYVVCGVAPKQWLTVQAWRDSSSSASIDLPPSGLRVQRRDLLIGPITEADSSRRGSVIGTVTDAAGAPFAAARILLDGQTAYRSSDDGRFTIPNAPAGTHQLEISSIGMTPVVTIIDVGVHDTAVVAAQLVASTVLNGVEVNAVRAGRMMAAEFDQRRRAGRAFVMDSTELIKSRTLPNALTSVPSTVIDSRGGLLNISMTSGRGASCSPTVRIDGAEGAFGHLVDLHPDEVAAVEVYVRPTMIPAQFYKGGDPPTCGMILVWTKYGFKIR